MPTKEVSLPTGGRVWLRTRLTHAQSREREAARTAMPASALGRIVGAGDVQGADLRIALAGLDDADVSTVTAALRALDEATVRVCTHHSTEVHDTDGVEIRLPDDMDRLDEEDFGFLVAEANTALSEGYGDPNSSRGSSVTPPSPGGTAEPSPPTSQTPT